MKKKTNLQLKNKNQTQILSISTMHFANFANTQNESSTSKSMLHFLYPSSN